MNQAQVPAGKPARRRVGSGGSRAKPMAAKGATLGYVAMHEVNAAMCLAGGVLGPRFEEGAARDHHIAGGVLQVEATAPTAQVFTAARGDLSYGGVVVFEVQLPAGGQLSLPSLPLCRAKRLAFESQEARDLFRARTSGYGDVPDAVLPMVVDAALFAARGESAQASLPQAGVAESAGAVRADGAPCTGAAGALRGVDRCAGGLLAAISTLPGSPAPASFIQGLGGLVPGKPGDAPVEQFATAVALLADASTEAATFAPVLSSVASVLSSGEMDDGFSATTLLREAEAACAKRVPAGSPHLKAIQKFWAFTKDVLLLRREVPDGAWSDEGGSAMARGTLFFMLNPEPEQLQAARNRTPNLGTGVHFVAGLLVGLRSGLTRLGKEVKEVREPFLAGASFAHDWFHGHDASLALRRDWDAEDGSNRCAVAYEGAVLATAMSPSDPVRLAFAGAVRNSGVEARFAAGSGELAGKLAPSGPDAAFGTVDALAPVFPRQGAIEAWASVPLKVPRRAIETLVGEVNAGTREHCVAALLVDGGPSRSAVRLSTIVLKPTTPSALQDAVAALVARARGLVAAHPAPAPRRAKGGKAGAAGDQGQADKRE